jgi:transcriptional regulator with XRE-family HTH domain
VSEKEIIDTIKMQRKKLGLTQKSLAEALGVTKETVSRWESGNYINMAFPKLMKVLRFLKLRLTFEKENRE